MKKRVSIFLLIVMFFTFSFDSYCIKNVKANAITVDFNDPVNLNTKIQFIVTMVAYMGLKATTPDYNSVKARIYDLTSQGKFVLEQTSNGAIKITQTLLNDFQSAIDGFHLNDSKVVPITEVVGEVTYSGYSTSTYDYYYSPVYAVSNYSFDISLPYVSGDNCYMRKQLEGGIPIDSSGYASESYIKSDYVTGLKTYFGGATFQGSAYGDKYVKVQYNIRRPKAVTPVQSLGSTSNTSRFNTLLPSSAITDLPSTVPTDIPLDGYITYNPSATIEDSLTVPSSVVSVSSTIPIDTTVPADTTATIDYTMPSESKTLDFTPLQIAGEIFVNKFPFSLPFDIANSIRTLNVTPVAPKFTINFDSRYFRGGSSLSLDFSTFEKWAIIIRWGVMFLFTMFLILITRKVIGGGS